MLAYWHKAQVDAVIARQTSVNIALRMRVSNSLYKPIRQCLSHYERKKMAKGDLSEIALYRGHFVACMLSIRALHIEFI